MRKLFLQHLRTFGFVTDQIERNTIEQIDKFTGTYLGINGQLTTVGQTFQKAVSNVICGMIFGQAFGYDDPSFVALLEMVNFVTSKQANINVTHFVPEIMYPLFPEQYTIYLQKKKNYEMTRQIIENLIKSHEDTFDENNIRDFLDYYIKVKNAKDMKDNLANEPYFNPDNIYRVIYDLFLEGSETTSTALEWCFLYFIEFPDVQDRCRQQILDTIGDRQVKLSDRSKLPYVEAVILEVLRLSNVVPIGAPRANAEKDVFLNGFRIPKRATVLSNLCSANTDSKYWISPLEFNPDRFLDDKEQLRMGEAFVPLSIGPRNCPGDSLAKLKMFLFIAVLLQRFNFERDDDAAPHDLEPIPGTTLLPKIYKFKAVPLLMT